MMLRCRRYGMLGVCLRLLYSTADVSLEENPRGPTASNVQRPTFMARGWPPSGQAWHSIFGAEDDESSLRVQ
jgi:hypothetical protein